MVHGVQGPESTLHGCSTTRNDVESEAGKMKCKGAERGCVWYAQSLDLLNGTEESPCDAALLTCF